MIKKFYIGKNRIRIGRFSIRLVPNWRSRPHPYWFNVKYFDGSRKICIPLFAFDIRSK